MIDAFSQISVELLDKLVLVTLGNITEMLFQHQGGIWDMGGEVSVPMAIFTSGMPLYMSPDHHLQRYAAMHCACL